MPRNTGDVAVLVADALDASMRPWQDATEYAYHRLFAAHEAGASMRPWQDATEYERYGTAKAIQRLPLQ